MKRCDSLLYPLILFTNITEMSADIVHVVNSVQEVPELLSGDVTVKAHSKQDFIGDGCGRKVEAETD
eukprot:760497-Hanusia_phi.AAC.3